MAQRRLTLTVRGAIVVVLVPLGALAGALLGVEELVLVSLVLCTLLLIALVQSAYRARRDRGIWRVAVTLPASDIELDSPATMRVTVAVTGRDATAPVWLEAPEDGWVPSRARAGRAPSRPRRSRIARRLGADGRLSRARAGWGIPRAEVGRGPLPNPSIVRHVPPLQDGAAAPFSFTVPTRRRGVFTLRPLRLWCADSFGLLACIVAASPRAGVTVHPAPMAVDLPEELLRGDPREAEAPSAAALRRDSLGDFSGLRPYIPGDRLRLLYWPALARRDELMVRDFEDSEAHRLQVVADLRPLIGVEGCESVLAVVAGVGLASLALGSVVELSTTAGERLAIEPGPHGSITLLRALARIEIGEAPPAGAVAAGAGAGAPHPAVAAAPAGAGAGAGAPHFTAGTQLVVTTSDGAQEMLGSFESAHLVIAP